MSVKARPEVRALPERGARPRPSLPVRLSHQLWVQKVLPSGWGRRPSRPSLGPGFGWKLCYEQPLRVSGNGAQGTEHRDTGTRVHGEWQGLRLTCDLRPGPPPAAAQGNRGSPGRGAQRRRLLPRPLTEGGAGSLAHLLASILGRGPPTALVGTEGPCRTPGRWAASPSPGLGCSRTRGFASRTPAQQVRHGRPLA